MMAHVVGQDIVEQADVVTGTAATVELKEVGEVGGERMPREGDPPPFELELIQVRIEAV